MSVIILVLLLALVFGGALVSAALTNHADETLSGRAIIDPDWALPRAVVRVPGTAALIGIGVAAWLATRRASRSDAMMIVTLFLLMLLLALAYGPVQSGLFAPLGTGSLWLSLGVSAALAAVVGVAIFKFRRLSPSSVWGLYVTLAWAVYLAVYAIGALAVN